MMNQLDALKRHTTVVVDTGDFHQMARFRPQDATTNPSLILKAVQKGEYAPLLRAAVAAGGSTDAIIDRLLVRFGCEILQLIPGRVSTEVDARLSFDAGETAARARRLMALYRAEGIAAQRVLIKIAATWEGIAAARELEQEGIHTNLTLLFSLHQALACAAAGVRLISPFVGRIYDWHKKRAGAQWNEAAMAGANDPGVRSVRSIYTHYKHLGIATEIMGASFRNTGQIVALAGCDLLTIAPELLAQLSAQETDAMPAALSVEAARTAAPPEPVPREEYTGQARFLLALAEDAMTCEKLAEGIRAFALDTRQLEALIGNC